ncbi:universal stress protein [Terasakiella pusilla]|uniref:universal stress protein n=1 Tax=Terasakiella pusilla TaxID=64973 RepID=UPI00048EA181|nr:universal stress protein [Terasakiella pusilla]
MSVKNILSVYPGLAGKQSALKHAIKIAKLHGAWLTGVISHQGQSLAEGRFGGRLPPSILEELQELDKKHLGEVKVEFERMMAENDLSERGEFMDLDQHEVSNLSSFARAFDLVVMSPHSSEPGESHISAHPDRVALEGGRPVLIVPNGYEATGLADHALIAWDGKRAAARALGDAMHYLETKPKVTILCVGKKATPGIDQLLKSLDRHGVETNLLIKSPERSIGQTILTTLDEVGAKLLVMGAYEHSKFSQDLFGGVTHDVMQHCPVPLFLSH